MLAGPRDPQSTSIRQAGLALRAGSEKPRGSQECGDKRSPMLAPNTADELERETHAWKRHASDGCHQLHRAVGGSALCRRRPMTQAGTLCPELCGPRAAPGPVASSLKPPKDTMSQAPGPVNVTLAQTANVPPLSPFRWGDDPGLCPWTPNATPSVLGEEGTTQGDSTPRGRPGTWLGDHRGWQTLPRARESRLAHCLHSPGLRTRDHRSLGS